MIIYRYSISTSCWLHIQCIYVSISWGHHIVLSSIHQYIWAFSLSGTGVNRFSFYIQKWLFHQYVLGPYLRFNFDYFIVRDIITEIIINWRDVCITNQRFDLPHLCILAYSTCCCAIEWDRNHVAISITKLCDHLLVQLLCNTQANLNYRLRGWKIK